MPTMSAETAAKLAEATRQVEEIVSARRVAAARDAFEREASVSRRLSRPPVSFADVIINAARNAREAQRARAAQAAEPKEPPTEAVEQPVAMRPGRVIKLLKKNKSK